MCGLLSHEVGALVWFLINFIYDLLLRKIPVDKEPPWYLQPMRLGDWRFGLFLLLMSGFWTSFNQIFYTLPLHIRDFVDTGDLMRTSVSFLESIGLSASIESFKTSMVTPGQINPEYIKAYNSLGSVLSEQGRFDEALVSFQQALRLNPGSAETHYNLGLALQAHGNIDEAIIHYRQALLIRPNYLVAHRNLGNVLLRANKYDEALTHLETALRFEPNQVEVLNNLAWIFATHPEPKQRNAGRAVELAERARIRDYVSAHDPPAIILTDGLPLINTAAWSVAHFYKEELVDDEELYEALSYLAGEETIPLGELPRYMRRAWPVALVNRLRLCRFRPRRHDDICTSSLVLIQGQLIGQKVPHLDVQLHKQLKVRWPIKFVFLALDFDI